MAFLSLLLFLLPAAAYVIWLRRHPGEDLPTRLFAPVLAALALGLAGLVWYGLSSTEERGTAYVPARLEDGRVVRGRAERAPPAASAQQQQTPPR
jgi:uncharacterized protein DUF6111